MGRKERDAAPQPSTAALNLAAMAEMRVQQMIDAGEDLDAGLEQVLGELTDTKRMSMIQERFDQLAPVEQLTLLAGTFDDDTLRQILAQRREVALQQEALNALNERVTFEAETFLQLDLAKIPTGHVVQLDLHSLADYRNAGMDLAAFCNGQYVPDLKLLVRKQANDVFRVLELAHNANGPHFNHNLQLQQNIHIASGEGEHREPMVHFGATFAISKNGNDWEPLTFIHPGGRAEPGVLRHAWINRTLVTPHRQRT